MGMKGTFWVGGSWGSEGRGRCSEENREGQYDEVKAGRRAEEVVEKEELKRIQRAEEKRGVVSILKSSVMK
jgi:hypothetical protein